MNYNQYTVKLERQWGGMLTDMGDYIFGPIANKHGIVTAISTEEETKLEFIHAGVLYTRRHNNFNKILTRKELLKLSASFVDDCVNVD